MYEEALCKLRDVGCIAKETCIDALDGWEELAPKSKSEPLKLVVREPTPVVLGL